MDIKFTLFEEIQRACGELEQEFHLISNERKAVLGQLKNYVAQKYELGKTPQVIVVCTHNSRRSHMGQLWLAVAADFYGLPNIQTFSGGTEATALNIRAARVFRAIGFDISTEDESVDNPIYNVLWKKGMPPYQVFSKKYNTTPNPIQGFAAIMVCSEADEACPSIFGCDFRLALPYDDPKIFDDTHLETNKYNERVRQIGREMLYVLHQFYVQ